MVYLGGEAFDDVPVCADHAEQEADAGLLVGVGNGLSALAWRRWPIGDCAYPCWIASLACFSVGPMLSSVGPAGSSKYNIADPKVCSPPGFGARGPLGRPVVLNESSAE